MEPGDTSRASADCGSSTGSIRELNDAFRRNLVGGKCVITAGVAALGGVTVTQLIDKVRQYSEFNPDNDPYGEHEFGAFDHAGIRFFWKIDLYEEPGVKGADGQPLATRVLTIMLAEEY